MTHTERDLTNTGVYQMQMETQLPPIGSIQYIGRLSRNCMEADFRNFSINRFRDQEIKSKIIQGCPTKYGQNMAKLSIDV